MRISISAGVLSITTENGIKHLVLCDGISFANEDYFFTLYFMDCLPGWNMPGATGDISTKDIGTGKFIKVGEWAGEGQFIEMNIYQVGLYATSKFDPSMVVSLSKEELKFLTYKDFEKVEIPQNTDLHEYKKALDKLYLQRKD